MTRSIKEKRAAHLYDPSLEGLIECNDVASRCMILLRAWIADAFQVAG